MDQMDIRQGNDMKIHKNQSLSHLLPKRNSFLDKGDEHEFSAVVFDGFIRVMNQVN